MAPNSLKIIKTSVIFLTLSLIFSQTISGQSEPTPVWPTVWLTPDCNTDPSDESPSWIDIISVDIIGDSYHPAVYYAEDENFLYLRERVEGDPSGPPGMFNQHHWVVLCEQTGDNYYDFLFALNGEDEMVQIWKNAPQEEEIDWNPVFSDEADTVIWQGSTGIYARIDPDGEGYWFVSWAIPKSYGEFTLGESPTLYFATSADANNYNKDHLICYEECQIDDDCDHLDDDYCDGDVRKHDEGICVDYVCEVNTTVVEDCNSYDGCYPHEDGCEDRDYYCSDTDGTICDYIYSNRNIDSYDSPELYCSANTIRNRTRFHDWYCNGFCTDHESWINDHLEEDCDAYDDYYDTGNTRWVSSGQCTEKEEKEQIWLEWFCNSTLPVHCDHYNTSTRWIDTGNTRNKDDGTTCDDGLYCTVNDVCTSGFCGGSPRDCSHLDDQCNDGACDEGLDQCVKDPTPYEGLACDDGLFCNVGETCQSGTCTGGSARDCSDSEECTYDNCNEELDQCENPDKPDGTDCTGDPGKCCSGVCDDDGTSGSDYHTDCRSGPSCIDIGDWGYSPANQGNTCDSPYGYECYSTSDCLGHYYYDTCDVGYCDGTPIEMQDNSQCDDQDCGTCCICSSGTRTYDETQDNDCSDTLCPDSCTIDTNPFTWDWADDVHNFCQALDTCTNYDCVYQHECHDNDDGDGIDGNLCGAECDQDEDCQQSTEMCDYTDRTYCTRDAYGTCNGNCECVYDDWSCGDPDDEAYCLHCNHCGDGTVNCGEECEPGQPGRRCLPEGALIYYCINQTSYETPEFDTCKDTCVWDNCTTKNVTENDPRCEPLPLPTCGWGNLAACFTFNRPTFNIPLLNYEPPTYEPPSYDIPTYQPPTFNFPKPSFTFPSFDFSSLFRR